MVIVNDETVRVLKRFMTVRMAVGFGSFPTVVVMLVMEIVGMFVLVEYFRVGVKQNCLVTFRP